MIRRFKIEDLIFQDASGVVFRALDTETGRMVAVRRLFPSGTKGVGLLKDEQTAYNIALDRLAGLNHPALRSVVCGGCDPVDGIPFIATEWIEGSTLEPIIRQRPLPADVALLLLTQALEVSELISHVLAEEAVWVETDLDTIVLGNEESGRGFTFWISPLKWLGGHEQRRGMESIIALTEKIMGWKGQVVNDQAGQGLGAWLKWLRKAAPTTTLREVRENLAAAVGTEPPPAAQNLVSVATRPPARKSSKITVLGGLGLVLIFGGAAGWLLTRNRPLPVMPDLAAQSSIAETPVPVLNETPPKAAPPAVSNKTPPKAAATPPPKSGPIFSPAKSNLLVKEKGKVATVEGLLVSVITARNTTYLHFSKKLPPREVRGLLPAEPATQLAASKFIGKKIRITGKVTVVKGRPEIQIANLAAIETVE